MPSPSLAPCTSRPYHEVSTAPSPTPESPALSPSDFPALSAVAEQHAASDAPQASEETAPAAAPLSAAAEEKAARKAAKKAAAAERAAERARIAQEKAVARALEKERLAKEKAAEKERQAVLKAEKERAAKEKADKERAEKEKAARERAEREQAAKERAQREAVEKAERERMAEAQRAAAAAVKAKLAAERAAADKAGASAGRKATAAKQAGAPTAPAESVQAPILARMPKKSKPVTKPIKIPKEDQPTEAASTIPSAATSEAPQLPEARVADSSSNNSRAHSVDPTLPAQPIPVEDLLHELHVEFPWLGLSKHPFFDISKINPASKVPLEYGPLVHALSALSVGGGSFANNMPSGSIDNAVSSFQQLLETLTQTISDLLRLLPRTTWDDSSSFDGVLRDMLKGDDFLDDGGDDGHGAGGDAGAPGREDEVAALTLALERRARWMEVQLAKLEELHRDINTAAVRAVLSFNDSGWDAQGTLPRLGNTLSRFDQIGYVSAGAGAGTGVVRAMTADELEKKLAVAKEAAQFVEAELREVMRSLQVLRPSDEQDES